MRIKKTSLLALIAGLLFFPLVAFSASENPPAIPLFVYGDVTIDGSEAPIGTTVSVFNDGEKVATTGVEEKGEYYVDIPAENKGETLVYKVNGIEAVASECLNPLENSKQELNLSVTTPTNPNNDNGSKDNSNDGNSSDGGTDDNSNDSTSDDSPNSTNSLNSPSTPDSDQNNPLNSPQDGQNNQDDSEQQVKGEKVENERAQQLNQILEDADILVEGDVSNVLENIDQERDLEEEAKVMEEYVTPLMEETGGQTDADIKTMNNFVAYGTPSTLKLGAGERAGVVNSYRAAFNELPSSDKEWQDAIKIANGRWPSQRSEKAENRAEDTFQEIYKREPNMENPHDNAAVTIMAYGLRPDNRNTESEAAAINSFEAIYNRTPQSATDWDTVRAIAYSGASR